MRDLNDPAAPAEASEDNDRAAILARRRFLVRRAVQSLGVATIASALANCAPCLRVSTVSDGSTEDATPEVSPQACLAAPAPDADRDAAPEASVDASITPPDSQ